MSKVEIIIQKGEMKVSLQEFKEDDPACRFMQTIVDTVKASGVQVEDVKQLERKMREHNHVHDYNGGH
jgi:hypothetical protein